MNLDLLQVGGELMLMSQFTLAADTNKGKRPSFSRAAEPALGRELFDYLLRLARARLGDCATGEFGAHMLVQLVNDGPVTLQLRVAPARLNNPARHKDMHPASMAGESRNMGAGAWFSHERKIYYCSRWPYY